MKRSKKEKRKRGDEKKKMNKRVKARTLIVAAVAITLTLSTIAPAVAQPTPPTPYHIFGYVFYGNGTACNSPSVIITNTNMTGINWTAETDTSYNYYVLTLSAGQGYDVNVTHVLQFNVTSPDESQSNVTNQTVTPGEIDDGGLFYFNISFSPVGKCGDAADDDGFITVFDAQQVWRVAGHVIPSSALANEWAADVDCDGFITVFDAQQIWRVAGHVIPEDELRCCT